MQTASPTTSCPMSCICHYMMSPLLLWVATWVIHVVCFYFTAKQQQKWCKICYGMPPTIYATRYQNVIIHVLQIFAWNLGEKFAFYDNQDSGWWMNGKPARPFLAFTWAYMEPGTAVHVVLRWVTVWMCCMLPISLTLVECNASAPAVTWLLPS